MQKSFCCVHILNTLSALSKNPKWFNLYLKNGDIYKRISQKSELKGLCHEIFDLHFYHDLNLPGFQSKVFSNSVLISPRFAITKFENLDFDKILSLVNQHLIQYFSFLS